MPNVKAVIIRRNSSGNMTNRIITTPKAVNIVQEGLRASDNMTMMLSAEHAVQQGDEVYYIQDNLDTTNLRGVWNFYGGFRDESGYEHDDVYTAPYTMPACASGSLKHSDTDIDWKHKGYYKFNISTASNDGVQISKKFKNNDTSGSKVPVIDMSSDFDLILEFKTTVSTDGQILFDNYDHATSSGKGLKVQINPTSSNITIITDDGTTETTMVAGSITTHNTVTFVRIRRKAGVFKLYLDGVEKTLTNSSNSGNFNNNVNIHFFKEYNESTTSYSNGWSGVPIQFRFYNAALSDDEVKKLRVSKPVNTTMKFGGRIWKIDNKRSTKKLSCSSFAKELLNTYISTKTFTSSTSATLSGGGARSYNRYYATSSSSSSRPDMEDILQDILKYVDDGVYSYFSEHPSTSFQGDFYADGTLLDIIKSMLMVDADDHVFGVTPRKILFINLEVATEQVISKQNYNIVFSGKDDTVTTNSLYVTGRKKIYTATKTFSSLASPQNDWTVAQAWTDTSGFTPVVERILKVTRGGTEIYAQPQTSFGGNVGVNSYRLNDDNTVQFWNHSDGNAHTYVITYEYTYTYNRTGQGSLSWSTTQFKQNTTSIDTDGLYHRNFNVPQLANGFDVSTFGDNYIAKYKDINTRHRAISGSLINSLTVGQKVRFTDLEGNNSEKVVKTIEYSYPQAITTIELGEYMFSGFDVEKQTIDSVRSLDSSVSISRY